MRDGSAAERNLLSKTGFRLRCANPLVRGHALDNGRLWRVISRRIGSTRQTSKDHDKPSASRPI